MHKNINGRLDVTYTYLLVEYVGVVSRFTFIKTKQCNHYFSIEFYYVFSLHLLPTPGVLRSMRNWILGGSENGEWAACCVLPNLRSPMEMEMERWKVKKKKKLDTGNVLLFFWKISMELEGSPGLPIPIPSLRLCPIWSYEDIKKKTELSCTRISQY